MLKMELQACGALRSPPDERDYIAENIFPRFRDLSVPETLDFRPDLEDIRSQGRQGSCVAQSVACMKEWQEKIEVKLSGHMSPQFVYNNRENKDTEGMYCRDAMKILLNIGICREYTYRYGIIEAKDKIRNEAFDEALKYKIKSYAQVNTINGLKMALYKNGPCIVAFPCYSQDGNFWIDIGNGSLGGHCVAIVGYNHEGFILRNSWGAYWNGDGYTIYPYGDFGSHWDIWTSVDENSSTFDHPKHVDIKLDDCCVIL